MMPERLDFLATGAPKSPPPSGTRLDFLAPKSDNALDKATPEVAKDVVKGASAIVGGKEDNLKKEARIAGGFEPDVDYGFDDQIKGTNTGMGKGLANPFTHVHTTSLPIGEVGNYLKSKWKELKKFPAQFDLMRADNPHEAKLSLEKLYGQGNVGQDKRGRWWFKNADGKKEAVFGGGQVVQTGAEKFTASVAASAPELAGASAAERFVGFPLAGETMGMSIPAAWYLGGAAGKGLDEVIKAAQGQNTKKPMEELSALNKGGLETAAGMTTPHVLSKALTGVKNIIPKWLVGSTDEGKKMVNDLLAEGYRPPLASAAPGLKAAQQDVTLANAIHGNQAQALNVAKMKHEMVGLMRDAGLTTKEAYGTMRRLIEKTEALSTKDVGQALTRIASARMEALKGSAETSLKFAKGLADKSLSVFKKLGSKAEPVGADTSAALQKGRQDVSSAFNYVYGHVGEMTENKPFAPLYLLKNKIHDITNNMAPDSIPLIYKNILAMPEADVPIMKMHDIRSRLWDEASSSNLTPGSKEFYFSEAARMADGALKQAEKDMRGTPYEKAVPFMRQADESYAKAIAPYKDRTINKLVQDMKTGLQPNPEVTANILAEYGQDERTRFIMKTLTPEVRRKVGEAYMRGIFSDAERMTGSNDFLTSGRSLLKALNDRGSVLDEVYDPIYGKGFVDKLKDATKNLAALDGRINLKTLEERLGTLSPGAVLDAGNKYVEDLKAIDDFAKKDPLGSLASTDPRIVDAALRNLVQPGHEATLVFAAHKLGPDSPQWKMVQNWALEDVLSRSFNKLPTGVEVITGRSLKEQLRLYTKAQQDLLFPNGMIDKLGKIANKADFLFPLALEDFGSSLAAASIKLHVPISRKADIRYFYTKFLGWVSQRPAVLDYLNNGLDNPSLAERVKAETAMQEFFQLSLVQEGRGPGSGQAKGQTQ